ncbi:unnamed protein product [Peronospora destructor]|uniref:Uncharacterized protein n=1 Tax=Peronospora destructor TaxID=86335 RepID=A0AAV0SVF3_9STRA|nr:unnamed protein product [Peronospora destructor]
MSFPIDLTEIMAEEEDMTVRHIMGYQKFVHLQSERSKMDRKKGGSNGAARKTEHLLARYAGDAVHHVSRRFGLIKVGCVLECQVDYVRHAKVAPNHIITHVLDFALPRCWVKTVDQCGSLVEESRLRFDFTNSKALEPLSWRTWRLFATTSAAAARGVHAGLRKG